MPKVTTWKCGLETHFASCLKSGTMTLVNSAGSITSKISSSSFKNITCRKNISIAATFVVTMSQCVVKFVFFPCETINFLLKGASVHSYDFPVFAIKPNSKVFTKTVHAVVYTTVQRKLQAIRLTSFGLWTFGQNLRRPIITCNKEINFLKLFLFILSISKHPSSLFKSTFLNFAQVFLIIIPLPRKGFSRKHKNYRKQKHHDCNMKITQMSKCFFVHQLSKPTCSVRLGSFSRNWTTQQAS